MTREPTDTESGDERETETENVNETDSPTSTRFNRRLAQIAVGGYQDAQDVRMSMMNRVRDVVRKKREGIPFDETEDEIDPDDRDWDNEYKDENLPDLIAEMRDDGMLTEHEFEYLAKMLEAGSTAETVENSYKSVMGIAETEPIYTRWLENVYGVSTVLTARLLHTFGYCEEFDRVSNLWSYTGLAPGQERTKGEKLGYNPDAKTLAWTVADCMIKMGDRSLYRTEFYDPYKEEQLRRMGRAEEMTEAQLESVEWTPPESLGHADARARRYLAKKFLKAYWYHARRLEGLETPDEWVVTHGGHEKRTDTFENPMYQLKVLNERANQTRSP